MSRFPGPAHYTLLPVRSTVETFEANKVKLSIEVDAEEFERQVDEAFRRLARQVRMPGFRPGKAPRRVLEARLGNGVARQEALREALPEYYAEAVKHHEVDVIAAPELELTSGAEDGGVAFEAVVETRPHITLEGYESLSVTIPSPFASDEQIDERIERMRAQHAEFETVERAAEDGDQVRLDIAGSQDGVEIEGLTATDYLYEVGSGAVVAEIDDNLRGASAGDQLSFDAPHPEDDEEADLHFEITVKEVRGSVLPELDDAFVQEATEHQTLEEWRAALREQLSRQRIVSANMALQQKAAEALAALVTDDVPEPLVQNELSARLNNLDQRLRSQGVDLGRYLQLTGQSAEDVVAEYRTGAEQAVRVDLALRAVADAQGFEVTEDDIESHLAELARRFGGETGQIRENLERAGQMLAVRSDIRKGKALDWLLERVEIVDEEGNPVDRSALDLSTESDDDTEDDSPDVPGEDAE
jgi:trigger factor